MDLVKSVSIGNLLNQREAVLQRLRSARDLIEEARKIASAAHLGCVEDMFSSGRYGFAGNFLTGDFGNVERWIDKAGWEYLMAESGIRTFMDSATRQRWAEAMNKEEIPPLTVDVIASTFGQLYDNRQQMFENGVVEIFRRLSWNYKTNEPFKFGRRIVLSYILQSDRWGGAYPRNCDQLDDLERALYVLDGKPEPDHRQSIGTIVRSKIYGKEWSAETDYFALRWYKKGSAHVTFKRPDLIGKLNSILAARYPNALASDTRWHTTHGLAAGFFSAKKPEPYGSGVSCLPPAIQRR